MKIFTLNKYVEELNKHNLILELNNINDMQEIEHVCYNSKEVKNNTLFVCKGINYKKEYLDEAINNGAIVYICEREYESKLDIPHIVVSDIRKALAIVSQVYYDFPATKIDMIGITGTKGKSTTAYYIKSVLDYYMEVNHGNKIAILSSIDNYDGTKEEEAVITCPESLELANHVYNAVSNDIEHFVMEVSSQALKVDRVYNVLYNIGIFTNIGIDHISDIEHHDFEDYFATKLKLFSQVNNAIVNMDSDYASRILDEAKKCKKVITYSTINKKADVFAYDINKIDYNTIHFKVKTNKFDQEFELNMSGLFNVYNALATIAVSIILDIPVQYMVEGLKVARASGRMESHITSDEKIIAIVDYAHNKLSFEKLYESVLKEYPNRKIITVFGCPGGHAENRRKDLGLLSGKYSYITYLTSEDPGKEDVQKISEEIALYVKQEHGKYKIINDREEAIKTAIKENKDCVILITGKGNETYQKEYNGYVPYKTDTSCVIEAIDEYEKERVLV